MGVAADHRCRRRSAAATPPSQVRSARPRRRRSTRFSTGRGGRPRACSCSWTRPRRLCATAAGRTFPRKRSRRSTRFCTNAAPKSRFSEKAFSAAATSTEYPRPGRGAAATRLHGISRRYHTSDPAYTFMLVLATNRPGDLDAAVLDRVDEAVEIPLPHEKARERLLHLYPRPRRNLSSWTARLRRMSTSWPRRRRDSSPRNVHVAAAASPRSASA